MPAPEPAGQLPERRGSVDVAALIPIVRRIVAARVADRATADDLVQETLARVLGAVGRIEAGMLEPYAIVTARNVVASMWREQDRQRRHQHRVVDLRPSEAPDEDLLAQEDRAAMAEALTRLSDRERDTLLAHEVSGQDTRSLARELGSTAGAVAAQLNRTRARLRVEYLLAAERVEPDTERCRPVLLAISSGDRRRQREVDAARHLLECELCARLSEPLMGRGRGRQEEVRVAVRTDADVVAARQAARELAERLDFSPTELTEIATAVSEIVRNIVRFADSGDVLVELLDAPRRGLRITARDSGPGIADVQQALQDGYSTYQGLGLGLPGARRLMDEFAVVSERGRGTTVTMIKWRGAE
ncbi:sigma-70 family RNA polymerase sigma factor [Petropleomorpha daqingensis]|uniref:Serine/threonine-protein kinase RsbT n=1 Tax=Petropleomorpha daqingensis TaxID=2026353 RepID=A0A853CJI2_9ACTN|nr:sigma-70 family RNA polymerase sigma factor [Petropleomorpha daqingensis]NYJ07516.1 serine/threonine-protein kinase RsbT [Petropleomorpha daqingensis]